MTREDHDNQAVMGRATFSAIESCSFIFKIKDVNMLAYTVPTIVQDTKLCYLLWNSDTISGTADL